MLKPRRLKLEAQRSGLSRPGRASVFSPNRLVNDMSYNVEIMSYPAHSDVLNVYSSLTMVISKR